MLNGLVMVLVPAQEWLKWIDGLGARKWLAELVLSQHKTVKRDQDCDGLVVALGILDAKWGGCGPSPSVTVAKKGLMDLWLESRQLDWYSPSTGTGKWDQV